MADQNPDEDTAPVGMRPASVASISIFMAFGLAFARFWAFDTSPWQAGDSIAGVLLTTGICVLLVALWRGLDPTVTSVGQFKKIRSLVFSGFILLMLSVGVALAFPH